MRSGRNARRARRAAITLTVCAVATVACTGSDDGPVATLPTTTTEPAQPREDDGVLHIGALVPANDPTVGAAGADLVSAFERAVEVINVVGGVLGSEVRWSTADEGSTAGSAALATQELIEGGVDAIVGPTSSNTAIGALDAAVSAGIVTCSATATAISLDDFTDDNDDGLFFRSVAPDSLQAAAIATEAKRNGAGSVIIVHVDDAYGEPYAAAVDDEFADSPSIQVETIAVPFGDDDLDDELDEIAAVGADTGIVLGSGPDIARLLEAISSRTDIDVRQIIVNDAARAPSSRPVIAALNPEFRGRITGLSPQILLPESVDSDDDSPFASQIGDCVNLIALAAEQGESDAPAIIASQMASVSSGGEPCRSFAGCMALLAADDDRQINYDGPGRITELARDGDPLRAFFDRFVFSADGSSVSERRVAIP